VREQLVALAWRAQAAELTTDLTQRSAFEADLRSSACFKAVLDKLWPTQTPQAVLRRLYANDAVRARASGGVLSAGEQESWRANPNVGSPTSDGAEPTSRSSTRPRS
jgi:hypothetical protein